MTEQAIDQRFVERVRELLVSLPYDLKVLFEMASDEDLSKEVRKRAAGGIVYCLALSDPIPDSAGVVGYVDDAVLVRMLLDDLRRNGGEGVSNYSERFREQFEGLTEDVALLDAYLGDQLTWVRERLGKLDQMKYKGKSSSEYVEDEEAGRRLYEDGLQFTTDYEIDEEAASKLRSGQSVKDAFAAIRR